MVDFTSTYTRIADNRIANLRDKCLKGVYSERLFNSVAQGMDKFYTLEKLEWMKSYLDSHNQHIAAGCLECLCAHGYDLMESIDLVSSRVDDRVFSGKVIDLAEKYDKPDILLAFMNEEKGYINRVIMALKKTHHEDYLTTLLLSDNEALVKSVDRLTKDL